MLAARPENAIIRAIGELVVPSINNSVELLSTLAGSADEPWDDLIRWKRGSHHYSAMQTSLRRNSTHFQDRSQNIAWDSRPWHSPRNSC
ncbi:hypothetical protein BDW66DRAFT_145196 [Aspergillus desertorum]